MGSIKEEVNQLREQNQILTNQLNQISSQAIQLQSAAQNNEIILNRKLRYITRKLIQLKKNPTIEQIDELIEYFNRVENVKQD